MTSSSFAESDSPRSLSIGQVLDLLRPEFPDLSASKLRFLEEQKLITLERTGSGYRKFYAADVERIRVILTIQRDEYLPLKVIRTRLEQSRWEAERPASNSPSHSLPEQHRLSPVAGDSSAAAPRPRGSHPAVTSAASPAAPLPLARTGSRSLRAGVTSWEGVSLPGSPRIPLSRAQNTGASGRSAGLPTSRGGAYRGTAVGMGHLGFSPAAPGVPPRTSPELSASSAPTSSSPPTSSPTAAAPSTPETLTAGAATTDISRSAPSPAASGSGAVGSGAYNTAATGPAAFASSGGAAGYANPQAQALLPQAPERLRRQDLLDLLGIETGLFTEAVTAGFIDPAEYYGRETLELLTSLKVLWESGITPRHLSVIKNAVDRSADLVCNAVKPLQQNHPEALEQSLNLLVTQLQAVQRHAMGRIGRRIDKQLRHRNRQQPLVRHRSGSGPSKSGPRS